MLARAILFLFIILILGCAGDPKRVDRCPKPHDIPYWVKWDCELYDAYKEGELWFNEDSTAYAIQYGDSLTSQEKKLLKETFKSPE